MIHPSKISCLPVAENLDFSIIVTTLKNHALGRFQEPSRRFQNALKTPPKTLQDAPKMVQNGPKRLQRRSRTIHVADQREYRCALVYSHTATDSHRQPQTAIDSHRQPQTATDSHRQPQTATDSRRQPQTPTDSHRHPQTALSQLLREADKCDRLFGVRKRSYLVAVHT